MTTPQPFDNGGLLRPGMVVVTNTTDQPERVLTPEELRRLTEEGES